VRSTAHALARVRRVRVGSTNEPKIAAVRAAIAPYAPDARVEGCVVESGVCEQPVGLEETSRGARNRAGRAFETGDCELAVGYEDGLVALPELAGSGSELLNVGCAVVTDGVRTSFGLSSGFAYPPACAARAASERLPIGDLFDELWRARAPSDEDEDPGVPSGRGDGNIGKLSLGVLTRSEYARHAIVCALVRFLHPDLYERSSRDDWSVA